MRSITARRLILTAILAAAASVATAQVPLQTTQDISCPEAGPEQAGFNCPDNWGLDRIDLDYPDQAYRYRWTGQDVHVYVLDSGIHVSGNEAEFGTRVEEDHTEQEYLGQFTYDDCSANGHGTRVASVIGGSRYGVAKDVTLHLVKYGHGCNAWTIHGFIRSLEFIRNDVQSARALDSNYLAVVSVSTNIPKLWGFNSIVTCDTVGGEDVLCVERVAELVDEIIDLEVPVVVSAGNYDNADGLTPSSFTPSDVARAFVIGGVDRSDARWRMDQSDPDYEGLCNPAQPPQDFQSQCGSNHGSEIDLWAPAEFILAATNPGTDGSLPQSHGVLSGTSFAAPHVSGAIAIFMEKFRAENGRRPTVNEVWTFLETNAIRDVLTGLGAGSPNLLLNTYFQLGPRPADDSYSTAQDTLLPILYSSLLANDQGMGLEVKLDGFSDPPHGTITVCCNPAGFKYTPDSGYAGADSFTYTVADDEGEQATATVNVNVVPGPIANDDSFTTPSGTQLSILYASLLENDQGQGLEVSLGGFSDPPHGTITVCCNPAGFKYTSDPGYVGADSFTYTAVDDLNLSDTAVVHVTVTNRPPVAVNDSAITDRNVPVTIPVLANDSDPDGHPLRVTIAGATINPNGTVTFTPPAGFVGTTTFPYTITDDQDGFASATVTVTVRQPNQPPAANSNSFSTPQNTPLDFTCAQLLANDSDPDGDPLTVAAVGQPSSGSTSCTACNCRYTPVSGFVGNASFSYTVSDGRGGTASTACTITVFNRAPVAVNDSASTPQNFAVTIPVLANDSDPDGNPLTVQSVTQPANGSAAIQPGGGAVVYTPGSVGSASFTYTVSDGKGGTATANVGVTILPPNTPPDARGNQLALPYGLTSTIHHATLLSNDFDPDGNALTISSFNTAGLNGTLSCPAGGTSCTYTPPYGFTGVTSYSYTASDGKGGSDSATVKLKVGVTQNPPVAADDLFTTTRNAAKAFTIFDVLANDTDPDGDVLNAVIVPGPRDYGSVSCTTPTYNCVYTPSAGYVGLDRFAYTADDQAGGSSTAYIRMVVLPPAFPGVLDAREDQFTTSQNTQRFISLGAMKGNDYDPEGDPLTITSYDTAGLNGSLNCTSDPNGCIYQPASYFTGTTRFKYTVSDGHGNTDTATVRIKVGVANGTPVITGDTLTTPKNTPVRFSIFELLKNDFDPENDPLGATIYTTTPTRGTLSCGTPQYWCTYTPFANLTGNDSFIYVISDGISYTTTATVNVTVTP